MTLCQIAKCSGGIPNISGQTAERPLTGAALVQLSTCAFTMPGCVLSDMTTHVCKWYLIEIRRMQVLEWQSTKVYIQNGDDASVIVHTYRCVNYLTILSDQEARPPSSFSSLSISSQASLMSTSYGASLPHVLVSLRLGMMMIPPSLELCVRRMYSGDLDVVPGISHSHSAPKCIHDVMYKSGPRSNWSEISVLTIRLIDWK